METETVTQHHFDGATYNASRDQIRLNTQLRQVWTFMLDGEWHSLSDIERNVIGSVPALSARLRDFRKKRFGAHTVNRRYVGEGLWEYQLIVNPETKDLIDLDSGNEKDEE